MLPARRPKWLNKKIDFDRSRLTSTLLSGIGIHTVCKEAKCPNISECFKKSHATFLILGKYCTRSCRFCNVENGPALAADREEPEKVAEAIRKMSLRHAVITSVTRDDLPDGGASVFAQTVEAIRRSQPDVTIELLIPDLKGDPASIETIAQSSSDIVGHNVETVPRLYHLRPKADYGRSLYVLRHIKKINRGVLTKSALMLGLGEKKEEVLQVLEDLRCVDCDFAAIGQYLRPGTKNTGVVEYINPEIFEYYKAQGLKMGFKHIESAPYVRSSFSASSYLKKSKN